MSEHIFRDILLSSRWFCLLRSGISGLTHHHQWNNVIITVSQTYNETRRLTHQSPRYRQWTV